MHGQILRVGLVVGAALALAAAMGCGPNYPNCENDKHCAAKNEVCIEKLCRQCRDDSQCTKVDGCMMCGGDNTCVKRAGCCKTDLDCPTGKCWTKAGATVGECGRACRASDDCPPGQTCAGGACVPAVSCSDDGMCGPGQKCVDGHCITATCEVQTVHFDFNEYAIRLDQEAIVRSNAECLKEIGLPYRVVGHCDERGSDEYNLALGQRRAGAVVRMYRDLGIDPALLSTISYGEEQPVCAGAGEDCWARNRRAETTKQ